MHFYAAFLIHEIETNAKQHLRKNKYDVSKNPKRATLVDETIPEESPLLAKARRVKG